MPVFYKWRFQGGLDDILCQIESNLTITQGQEDNQISGVMEISNQVQALIALGSPLTCQQGKELPWPSSLETFLLVNVSLKKATLEWVNPFG